MSEEMVRKIADGADMIVRGYAFTKADDIIRIFNLIQPCFCFIQFCFLAGKLIDSQIMKVDSDPTSTEYLYHLRRACPIYYGPDDRYDQMTMGTENQTVRVVGWTANKKWYKIVIDNGETGFVHYSHLEKGLGSPVPMRSHVYQN